MYGFGTIVVKMFGGKNIDKEKQKVGNNYLYAWFNVFMANPLPSYSYVQQTLLLCGNAKERSESLIAQFKLMDLSLVEDMREVVEFVQKCLSVSATTP